MRTKVRLKRSSQKKVLIALMDSYRHVRIKVNVLNNQLKKQYYTNKIFACQGNMKESWEAINELLSKRSKSSKLALPFIENSLAFLFNTSIETSRFPDSWKVARVNPIFKDGDKTEKSNYRPISVLPAISRFFEKLVANHLYQCMNDNGHFSSLQSGFFWASIQQ